VEEAFEESQGSCRAVEPIMMMIMKLLNVFNIGHVSTTLRNALTDNELVQIPLEDRYPIFKPY
jgi:hypothetical protein